MIMDNNVTGLDTVTKTYALISSNFIHGVFIMAVVKYILAFYYH
jgi:hypothetical protein